MTTEQPPPPPPPSAPPPPILPQYKSHNTNSHFMLHEIDSVSPNDPVLSTISDSTPRRDCPRVGSSARILIEGDDVEIVVNSETTACIQNGPRCGFAVIAMASQLRNAPCDDIDAVYHNAKVRGFTMQGELFSALDMISLLRDELGWNIELHHITSVPDTKQILLLHLLNNGTFLIAYDSDGNFEPCHKRGKAAHWALITGCSMRTKLSHLTPTSLPTHPQGLTHLPSLLPTDIPHILHHSTCNHVIAAHGKSRHLGKWNLDDLLTSNMNLTEPTDKIKQSIYGCVLPKDGLQGNLSHCVIILH